MKLMRIIFRLISDQLLVFNVYRFEFFQSANGVTIQGLNHCRKDLRVLGLRKMIIKIGDEAAMRT